MSIHERFTFSQPSRRRKFFSATTPPGDRHTIVRRCTNNIKKNCYEFVKGCYIVQNVYRWIYRTDNRAYPFGERSKPHNSPPTPLTPSNFKIFFFKNIITFTVFGRRTDGTVFIVRRMRQREYNKVPEYRPKYTGGGGGGGSGSSGSATAFGTRRGVGARSLE